MNLLITSHQNERAAICKSNGVKRLFAFGSVVSDKFNTETSDIDLYVEVNETDPIKKGNYMLNLYEAFEKLFNRKVDLLTTKSLRNPILKEVIDETKVLVYES
jgi:uncharacterized protein